MTTKASHGGNGKADYKIHAISMIRNDADIIGPFLNQVDELFDKAFIVDVQSTDGTREAIDAFAASNTKVQVYSLTREENYQSAIMNALTRAAFREGADWVFLLDVDEFIYVDSRQSLQDYLRQFPDDVMHLPWINLVPSTYGDFTAFDAKQSFFWTGKTSQFAKVAISNLFMANFPAFHIYEGNHCVAHDFTSSPREKTRDGLALLRVPVRSADRLRHKMSNAQRTLPQKHNGGRPEGSQVGSIIDLIQSAASLSTGALNGIAVHYGDSNVAFGQLDPVKEHWPRLDLPEYVSRATNQGNHAVPLTQSLLKDQDISWNKAQFVPGSAVVADIEGNSIEIRPQPMMGNGNRFEGRFAPLADAHPDAPLGLNADLIIETLRAALMEVRILTFSAWQELAPTLFGLFALTRPRRFVELGTYNGMSFFAACQAAEALELTTQCIAVDNWIGDAHSSFHPKEVFEDFCANLKDNFSNQFYVRAHFEHAIDCFEDESIDLLHIDGFHTYAAVKTDFDTWLPKMSKAGVVIFHDINVHDREFGVWRLWEELRSKYPSFSLFHCNGLGVLCVGQQPTALVHTLSLLEANPEYHRVMQSFLQCIGHWSIDYRKRFEQIGSGPLTGNLAATQNNLGHRARIHSDLVTENALLREQLHELLRSTSWRVTAPLRKVVDALGGRRVRRAARWMMGRAIS
jgi:hypothetical protein